MWILDNPPTTHDHVAVVEDDGLAGGDAALRFVEDDAEAVVVLRDDLAGRRLVAISDLCGRP